MSTTYTINNNGRQVVAGITYAGTRGRQLAEANPLLELLPQNTPVEAIDNSNGGIYTVEDLLRVRR